MTNIGIDEILNRLSVKFNRIFYDRDFVGCVSEDLQTIIDNRNKCCVLVFPTLSPNYLRVVRYQAKLCDLAVISLGTGSAKSVGVCHKKYFLPTTVEGNLKQRICCSTQMADNSAVVSKKKRPPLQLYVPPAQRKSRLNDQRESIKNDNSLKTFSVDDREVVIRKDKQSIENSITALGEPENNLTKDVVQCYCTEDIEFLYKKDLPIPYFSYQCNCVKIFLFKDLFPYAKLLIFSIKRMNHSFHWTKSHPKNASMLIDDTSFENWAALTKSNAICKNISTHTRLNIFAPPTSWDFRDYQIGSQNSYCLYANRMFIYLPDYVYYCYLTVPDFEIYDDGLKPENYLHCFEEDGNGSLYIEKYIQGISDSIIINHVSRIENLNIDSLLANLDEHKSPQMPLQKHNNCDSKSNHVCANEENDTLEKKRESQQIDHVVVLDERIEPPKIRLQNAPTIKNKTKQNEHEQEKEIMRKAKQNINRKTRPIIKYVDDDNDTLRIGKADNVNSWEDLFDEEGELQEDIFSEIIQKVGPEVTIVKATEDYSAYASKHVEELEHMVELYDFPSTLETHDIISAFSELNSDSMYVKWLDDTHALLVLGSYSQAQKAIELSNALIKVRPMSAASSMALEKANQFDLKPAMKRPQTNLQTARRLITSHLGAKSKVSKEQNAKEREDLRIAKEMKKRAKQNERDAWEGNLRSAIN